MSDSARHAALVTSPWSRGGWTSFMILSLLCAVAAAQEDTSAEPSVDVEGRADEGPQPQEPVILSATRTPILYRDASSTVTVLGETDREALAIPVLTDGLMIVPGLDVRHSGPAGQPTSLFLRGTDSDHVKFLLDGIDISDPSSPGGVPLLDHLFAPGVGQIEVIRGPQSTLYGSDAIGGVVSVFTRGARSGPLAATYEVEGGSFHTSRQRLTAEGASEHINAFVSLSYLDTEGVSASATGSERDPYRNLHTSSRAAFDLTDELKVETALHYIRAQTEFDLFGADDPVNQTVSEQLFVKIEPQLFLCDGKWISKLNMNLGIHDRDTFDRLFVGDIYGRKTFDGQAYEADWQNDVQLADWNLMTFGAEFRHERSHTTSDVTVFSPPASATHDRDITSFYLQDQIRFLDGRVHIVPGIRHDHYSDFGSHTTWRIAASYRHRETGTTLHGSYGTAFKAPSLFDLFDPSFGNSSLDAEQSRGWDLGVEQSLWKERVTLGATYFQNDLDELIQFDFVTFTPQNIGEARTRGVEIYGLLAPCENLSIRPSYTYTDTENLNSGARLLRRPLHKAGVETVAQLVDRRLTLGLGVFYIGDRDDISPATFATVTNDDYWLVRLAASLRVNDHLDIIARVENLLDEDYQDVLGFNSPGIAAYGGVRIRIP